MRQYTSAMGFSALPPLIGVVVLVRVRAYRSLFGERGVGASEGDLAVHVVVTDCREKGSERKRKR